MKKKERKTHVTTKTGDSGQTSLWGGKKIRKDDLSMELMGDIDEVSSYLGLIKTLQKQKKDRQLTERIQKHLFLICSEVAGCPKERSPREYINDNDIALLEDYIKAIQNKNPEKLDCFYFAGANMLSAFTDIARSVTRRAERRVVTLKKKNRLKNISILIYLNRLSDLLYLLARRYASNP